MTDINTINATFKDRIKFITDSIVSHGGVLQGYTACMLAHNPLAPVDEIFGVLPNAASLKRLIEFISNSSYHVLLVSEEHAMFTVEDTSIDVYLATKLFDPERFDIDKFIMDPYVTDLPRKIEMKEFRFIKELHQINYLDLCRAVQLVRDGWHMTGDIRVAIMNDQNSQDMIYIADVGCTKAQCHIRNEKVEYQSSYIVHDDIVYHPICFVSPKSPASSPLSSLSSYNPLGVAFPSS